MMAQIYVKQIVKKVKCSGKKRKEIRRQLLADIQAEMEQGVSLDVVMLRMGEPIAVAEEFNQNLEEQERRKYKRGFAIKILTGIAVILTAAVLTAFWFLPMGVSFGSSGLFEKAVVEQRSKEVIQILDTGDYEAFKACIAVRVQNVLTKEVIDAAREQAGADWGKFREFGKCYLGEQRYRGETRAVAQINAAYENIGVTYTLFFDEDMKLSGFYIK